MLILIPLFTPHTPEAVLDRTNGNEPYLKSFLARFCGREVVCLTDSAETKTLVNQWGWDAALAGTGAVAKRSISTGILSAVQCLDTLPSETVVAIVDPKSCTLEGDELDEALQRFESTGRPVFSCRRPQDHPAQLHLFLQTVENEVLVQLDADYKREEACWKEHGLMATAPFPFGWVDFRIYGPGPTGLYSFDGVRMASVDDGHALMDSSLNSGLFAFEGRYAARRVYAQLQESAMWPDIRFASTMLPLNRQCAVVCRNDQEVDELWVRSDLLGEDRALHVETVGRLGEALSLHSGESVSLGPADGRTRTLFGAEFARSPLSLPRSDTVDSIVLVFSEHAKDGAYDIQIPLDMANDLWEMDRETGNMVNVQSKAVITGRQELPHLFKLDPSFVVGTLGQLRNVERHLESGDLELLERPLWGRIKLDSALSALEYEIFMETCGQGKNACTAEP